MNITQLSFTDVDEFTGRMGELGWQGIVSQSQPGNLNVELSLVRSPGVTSIRTRHSLANTREISTPKGSRTFGLVVPEKHGNSWCNTGFDEVVLQMMPRSDYTAANPAGHLGFQMAFADERVAAACEQHEIRNPLPDDPALIELTDVRRVRMLQLLDRLFSTQCKLSSAQLSDELLSIFVVNFKSSSTSSGRARAKARHAALRRAREYIHAHIAQAITLADVAESACVSRRTLTHAFQESLGMGPMTYLKLLRLNRVRHRLCQPRYRNLRIIDAASEYGFWHLGQFARDYRALFGELPSETRRIARSLEG